MIIVECEQGTPEWHAARAGVITASMFSEVRKRLKSGPNKGDYTAAARKYAKRLALERITWEPLYADEFDSFAMRRGRELEPEARLAHEERIGMMIQHAGFIKTDCGRFGASADGLIADDGGSEYKCLIDADKIIGVILDGDISEYTDQMQGCMWIGERSWWHYGLYCPQLAKVGLDLTVLPVTRDAAYISELTVDLLAFDKIVEEYRVQILEAGAHHAARVLTLGGEEAA